MVHIIEFRKELIPITISIAKIISIFSKIFFFGFVLFWVVLSWSVLFCVVLL
jgi:hypothetical protein